MIKVGITGCIGSGKSIVCGIFSRLGVPVFSADTVAGMLVESDTETREELKRILGSDIFKGTLLNRSRMADMIFNSRSLLEQVNKAIHPKVARQFHSWCGQNADHPYLIHESALLFESALDKLMDRCITVSAPEEIRIQRVLLRKDMTMERVRAIMRNQFTEQEKINRSHHVILNDGLKPLVPQVLQLHASLTATGK